MTTINQTFTVDGEEMTIQITVKPVQTRFGQKFVASNDYGEPKNTVKAFNSIREAVANEVKELKQMFSYDNQVISGNR